MFHSTRKCKKSSKLRDEAKLSATTKSKDISMNANAAYEAVDVPYEDSRYGTRPPVENTEDIYEQPAL